MSVVDGDEDRGVFIIYLTIFSDLITHFKGKMNGGFYSDTRILSTGNWVELVTG